MILFDRVVGGRQNVVTMSYDDGRTYDRRLVQLFNTYGIKGTFHLNSGFLGKEGYVTAEEVAALYAGHEVSSHSLTHPHLAQLMRADAIGEVLEDRRRLEALCGYPVCGMSYPFGTYTDQLLDTLRQCGIRYSRTTRATGAFGLPEDPLRWHPTCHHRDAAACADRFLAGMERQRAIQLLYIWGHSYEVNTEEKWAEMEALCRRIGGDERVWYATNREIIDYMDVLRGLQIAVDGKTLYNPAAAAAWVSVDGQAVEIPGGATVRL